MYYLLKDYVVGFLIFKSLEDFHYAGMVLYYSLISMSNIVQACTEFLFRAWTSPNQSFQLLLPKIHFAKGKPS
jgi:hypothetical protein